MIRAFLLDSLHDTKFFWKKGLLVKRMGILFLVAWCFFGLNLTLRAQDLASWRMLRDTIWEAELGAIWPMLGGERLWRVRDSLGLDLDRAWYELRGGGIHWLGPKRLVYLSFRRSQEPRLALRQRDFLPDPALNYEDRFFGQAYTYKPFEGRGGGAATEGLRYGGSFTRGIALGNRQDLLLNSSLNLELSGELGGVEVRGAITDNNLPIQPQGNTQQLQDFERLYLEFKLKQTYLRAGDWQLENLKQSHFLRYNRRIQGGILGTQIKLGSEQQQIQVQGGFANARGKFARQSFMGQEGNQGPYRLQADGQESGNQSLLVIIAGSEKIFIDGLLLERGSDRDYIIDYNLAELRFTNKQMITKDKRIVVEFSYTELSYPRSLYTLQLDYQNKNTQIYASLFSEQDARSESNIAGLEADSLRALLQAAGRSQGNLLLPSLRPWTAGDSLSLNNPSLNLRYRLTDTLVNGIRYDSILLLTTDSFSGPTYSVRFSALGQGRGSYRPRVDNNNGYAFEWIAPDAQTGALRGSHEPVWVLVPPQRHQVWQTGWIQSWKKGRLKAEGIWSQRQSNRWASGSVPEEQGWATSLDFQQRLARSDSSLWQLELEGQYQTLSPYVQTPEPFREREFNRDWGLNPEDTSQEHQARALLGLYYKEQNLLSYELNALFRDVFYRGLRQTLKSQARWTNWAWQAQWQWNQQLDTRFGPARFLRPWAKLQWGQDQSWGLQAAWESERLEQYQNQSDSLRPNSLGFDVWDLKLHSPKAQANYRGPQFQAFGRYRRDLSPQVRKLQLATLAQEFGANIDYQKGGQWSLQGHFRNLQILDSLNTTPAQQSFLGRASYDGGFLKQALQISSLYELGGGQQARLDYQYLPVAQGLGTHVWIDRNNDGQQQQSEFERSPFPDQANYIQILVQSNQFIQTKDLSYNLSFHLQPLRYFNKTPKNKILDVLRKFEWRSQWRGQERNASQAIQWLPNAQNPDLVNLDKQNTHHFFWDRTGRVFSLEGRHQQSQQIQTLLGGQENRQQILWSLKPRWRPRSAWLLEAELEWGQDDYLSDAFAERNHLMPKQQLELQTAWQPNQNQRFGLQAQLRQQNNRLGQEQRQSWQLKTEGLWQNTKQNIRLEISYTQIQMQGPLQTPVAFILLEGLQPGANLQWSAQYNRNLSKLLQLSFRYEGRKTGEAAVVHLGNMQLRANF